MVKDPHDKDCSSWLSDVGLMFIFDDLVPQHIKDGEYRPHVRCHEAIELSRGYRAASGYASGGCGAAL